MSQERPKISAFVITKNEEKNIADCLASLSWVDEIVVVDDFSTDATPEICERFQVRFVQHPFTGFKDQKSFAVSLTTYDWVLELDADERVSREMKHAIETLPKQSFAEFSSFEFKRLTCFWGAWIRHGSFYPDYKGRLYDKRQGVWSQGTIHERFIVHGRTKKLCGDIIHVQDRDFSTFLLVIGRYADMSAKDYFRQGRKATLAHVTIRPVYTFIYRYFIRLGILDGMQGFALASIGAIGTFLKYMKLYELQNDMARLPVDEKQ